MAESSSAESPLRTAADSVGPHTVDALDLLAEETRLAILLALWEEYDPRADESVPFSRLFERTGYRDRGNFSYHLEKLEGVFIEQRTERGGYELTKPGLKLVRTVIAGTGVEQASVGPVEIDQDCPLCGASTTVRYRDGAVIWACTACEGAAPDEIGTAGALGLQEFEPAGVADRSPAALRAASVVAGWQKARSLFNGLCPTCSGPVDGWVERCRDHDPAGVCEQCGVVGGVLAQFECRICEEFGITSPALLAMLHPTVVAFYENHGVSTRLVADDLEQVRRLHDLVGEHEQRVVAEGPLRVEVTASMGGDEVRVTFDATASVVDTNP